ncbi:MAG: molecular chaperone DnaK [Patescibacteria group bacterium]
MKNIIGIDLGTTNSAVAAVRAGQPQIIENAEGNRTTPSIVAVSKTGERLVGLLAKRQAITNPQNTIFGIKRLMGHKFKDENTTRDNELVSYEISEADDGGVKVKMGDKYHRPEEVSAMILQKIKRDVEAKLGQKVEEAVITVPAYFDDSQRKATKDAGEIAGFKVRRIINEPTAAALAYGLNRKKNEQIAVYDFGGGTFDISILEIGSGEEGEQSIEVKATDGDSHMGGEDIDQQIIKWQVEEFKKQSGIDVGKDELALQRLKEAAEKAKHELSTTTESEINIPFITSNADGPQHLLLKLTRAKLEELADKYIQKSIDITKKAVAASGYKVEDIDEVILVGGQTRMPGIQEAVKKLFNKEPHQGVNPDEVVAIGAAIQGEILSATDEGRRPEGDIKDVLLLDVTPLSLGIETLGGVATKIVEKNTSIPTSRTQVFSTAADNQSSVEIHIVQGEREMAADNKSLGRFILDGIPPAPRGTPQIEVSFDLDANGILNVKAKDKTSGKEQSIKIEAQSSLKQEDIDKMKQDAEKHAEEDKKKRELIDIRNQAEQIVYSAEKAVRDYGDKIEAELKQTIETKIEDLKQAKDKDDKEAIETAINALSTELQKIYEKMQAEQPAADQQTTTEQPEENQNTNESEKEEDVDKDQKEEDNK